MEQLKFLIDYLAKYNKMTIDPNRYDFSTLRALLNITMPYDLSSDFYEVQDKYLQQKVLELGIVDVNTLPKTKGKMVLYRGDIVPLKCDAIVTAANEQLLGCFIPNHNCIDNAIFTYAGLELRAEMMKIMDEQGYPEPCGNAKVSKGYNLPAKHVFHTVGPAISGRVTSYDREDLRNCYLSCLIKASQMGLESIVFPSISTGVFAFPIEEASTIAINTVNRFLEEHSNSSLKTVVFDTYSERDYNVYKRRFEEIIK